ncbi:hypothetical protein PoB_000715700 [Plakobranchus ocellatus]|uniref:Uncharacterized protein n=1 Tax=Plakobranchus ocellatus TaxID=259542 RepID=A0AAV3YDX3_9GAST|nr:hypothetical protein PoB_000715700 [Plakobranchus ocellatus]
MYSPYRYGNSKSSDAEKSPVAESPPTPRYESSPYIKQTYFSTYHPSLLDRRKVLTPFGIGLCRREAFRALAKDAPEVGKYQKSTSMPALANPPRSPDFPPRQKKVDKSSIDIKTNKCGRGYVVRSKAKCDRFKEHDMKAQEIKMIEDLSKMNLSKDQLQVDVAAVKKSLPVKHITLLDVKACLSEKGAKNKMESSALMEKKQLGQSENPGEMSRCENTAIPVDTLDSIPNDYCQRGAPRYSSDAYNNCTGLSCIEKPKSSSSGRGIAWRREISGSSCSALFRPDSFAPDDESRTRLPSSSRDTEHLKIGTSVRILATPDICQPSFSAGQPRFIIAVVTYVTEDGRYKVGTCKGVIGRLFSREELQPRDRKYIRASDVPRRSISIREASTASFSSLS